MAWSRYEEINWSRMDKLVAGRGVQRTRQRTVCRMAIPLKYTHENARCDSERPASPVEKATRVSFLWTCMHTVVCLCIFVDIVLHVYAAGNQLRHVVDLTQARCKNMSLHLPTLYETACKNAKWSLKIRLWPLRAWTGRTLLRTDADIDIASCITMAVLGLSWGWRAHISRYRGLFRTHRHTTTSLHRSLS